MAISFRWCEGRPKRTHNPEVAASGVSTPSTTPGTRLLLRGSFERRRHHELIQLRVKDGLMAAAARERELLAPCAQRFDQGKAHRRATSDAAGLPDDHSVGTAHRYAQALVHKIPLGLFRRDFKVNLTPVALDEAFLNAKPQLVSSSKCSWC